uniref:Uncharacterized protein n=1 Tax=viral metagenome TaxID=1070528 RepID=A0A6M3JUU2_9ZZZZ
MASRKVWKSKRQSPKEGIWVSEIRLNKVDAKRERLVMRLLAKLDKEGFDVQSVS